MSEQIPHDEATGAGSRRADEPKSRPARTGRVRVGRGARRAGLLAAAGLLALMLTSVGTATAAPTSPSTRDPGLAPFLNRPGTRAVGVQFSPNTVIVPTSIVKADLKSVSTDQATYTFKSAAGPLAKLKPGKVMLLQGLAARKVTSASKKPAGLVVVTTPAAITDLVSNGTLSWNTPVDFAHGFGVGGSAVPIEQLRHGAGDAQAPLAARFGLESIGNTPITLKGKTDSYSYAVTFKSEKSAVSVEITIGKSSPVDLSATISGTLDNLSSTGSIGVHNSHLKSAKLVANGLKGQFKLSYAVKPLSALGLGSAGGIKITIPAELAVPFAIGGIPFFVGIKTAFFASVGFSGFNQSVAGSYTVNYDGKAGFSTASSGATSAVGAVKELGKVILNAANAVNKGPLTVIFGAQIPQLELGLGVKGLNVAGFVTLIADTGVATYGPGCDTRGLLVQASAGAEAKFFGFSASLGSTTLYQKELSAAYPAKCGSFPGF